MNFSSHFPLCFEFYLNKKIEVTHIANSPDSELIGTTGIVENVDQSDRLLIKWDASNFSQYLNLREGDSVKILMDWNCLPDGQEPDWNLYDAIEVGPVKEVKMPDGSTCYEAVEEGKAPDYWTVFLHDKEFGGVCDMHDCFDQKEAFQVAGYCQFMINLHNGIGA